MGVPSFNIDGVIAPFVGATPGGPSSDMTPYDVNALDVVVSLGTTDNRRNILHKWLDHREAMRGIGVVYGFQWLDGSFVEDKIPQDLDIVTMFFRPNTASDVFSISQLMKANPEVFSRKSIKLKFNLDAFFIDMNGSPETLVRSSSYYLGLFSHRRDDGLWKGMLRVGLEPDHDAAAKTELDRLDNLAAVAGA